MLQQDGNTFIILIWTIVGFIEEKIIWSLDFINTAFFTRIIQIQYSIFEYFIGSAWNYSRLWIYWIE